MSRNVSALVRSSGLLRRARRLSGLLTLTGVGACTSVLGIEDLHEGPAPGGGATDAGGGSKNPGKGGSDGAGGSGATASTGGTKTEGGTSTSPEGGESGTSPQGGDTGTTPQGGDTGAGGAPDPSDPTVRGKVIDLWGQAVSGVTVQIGDDMVTTNKLGEFTIEGVPSTYDVGLVVRPEGRDYGWYFVGLTRRNPTLQVYRGLDDRGARLDLRPKNIVPTDAQNITVSIGMPGGNWWWSGLQENGGDATVSWNGATTTTGTAHALLWTMDDDELPVSYNAYKTQVVGLEQGADPGTFSPDLTPVQGNLPSGTVQGQITDNDEGHDNYVFLRFPSNASIQVVE